MADLVTQLDEVKKLVQRYCTSFTNRGHTIIVLKISSMQFYLVFKITETESKESEPFPRKSQFCFLCSPSERPLFLKIECSHSSGTDL
jgi:hypothetical protein